MKKSILSMMLIGMMMLSSSNSFGTVKNTHFQFQKTEKIVNNTKKQDKACDCKTCKDIRKQHKQQCMCKNCKNIQQKHQQKHQAPCKQQNHKMKGCKNHK